MIKGSETFQSTSPEETMAVGRQLAAKLKPGDTVCLHGDLGAGKTRFVKGVASAFGISEHEVQSPTFTIINEYDGSTPVYHFDFYRVKSSEEAMQLGAEEYFYGHGISLIEWPSNIKEIIPPDALHVYLTHKEEGIRDILISIE